MSQEQQRAHLEALSSMFDVAGLKHGWLWLRETESTPYGVPVAGDTVGESPVAVDKAMTNC